MDTEKIEAKISGMHCAACSTRIERVLTGTEGVSDCSVNLATERANIVYNPKLVSIDTIRQTVSNLGFGAEPITHESEGFGDEADTAKQLLVMRNRLLPAFVLSILIMFLSMAEMVGITLPTPVHPEHNPFTYALLQFLFLLPVLYLGRNFYVNGIPALLRRVPNMDSLIAIGTGAAAIYSSWNLIEIALGIDPVIKAHDLYFEAAAMLISLVSLGKYLEAKSKARTGDAIRHLIQLTPDTATLLVDGKQRQIPVAEIKEHDQVLIRPGERIPVDGVVVDGESTVDESMLTGESMPQIKTNGGELFGGTLNKNGSLTMEAVKIGRDTVLARIVRLVQEAQGTKAPIANLADQISLYFVPVVITIALVASCGWYFLGGATFTFALRIFIAVLVIACPCAMGLATPTSIMVGTGRGAQLGVLVKTGEVLQLAEKVNCVVFDKTGTLTVGRPEVTDIIVLSEFSELQLLSLAAAAESKSEHPLAGAIVEAAAERAIKGVDEAEVISFEAIPGKGIRATLELAGRTHKLLLGNQGLLEEKMGAFSGKEADLVQELSEQAKTVLCLAIDDKLSGLLAIADPIREEAKDRIEKLKARNLELVMLTGDNEKTAVAVASTIGIDCVIAGVLPEGKEEEVRNLQATGKIVAMVGDGINDAPALARSDVGISMGTGIDVAIESADIVLMNSDLAGVESAIGLSRATMKNIRQNLFWAFAYNVVSIPVAAGLLTIWGGPTLNPMIGGAAMALSSVSVVTNALRLRFFKV